jgi:hypothetical protein
MPYVHPLCSPTKRYTNPTQLNCFIKSFAGDSCYNIADIACHCKKAANLIAHVQPCVQSTCITLPHTLSAPTPKILLLHVRRLR